MLDRSSSRSLASSLSLSSLLPWMVGGKSVRAVRDDNANYHRRSSDASSVACSCPNYSARQCGATNFASDAATSSVMSTVMNKTCTTKQAFKNRQITVQIPNMTSSYFGGSPAKTRTRHFLRQLSFVTLVLILLCCMLLHGVQGYDVDVGDDDDDVGNAAVGRSAHEPKFGERLLPLSRKRIANTVPGISVTRNLNGAQLNKSNYLIATPQQQQQQQQQLRSHELYSIAVSTLDVDVDSENENENEISGSRTRQAKQLPPPLNRREDVNMREAPAIVSSLSDASAAAQLTGASALNVSKADRLIEMSTEFFVVPTTSATPPASKIAIVGAKTRVNGLPTANDGVAPRSVLVVAPPPPRSSTTGGNASANANAVTPPSIVSTYPNAAAFSGLRKEPWVVPVLVLAALTMLMMGAFEIFVLFKAWRTSPSRRHLFLGQMLLLGLFACAGLGAILTMQPSLLSCGTIRFGVGVSYALVFAALLVKCVFLISLNGGVYLPAPYQGLLLLFAVLIQVAIGAQWLLTQPPEIYTLSVPIVGSGLLASTVASSTLITSSNVGAGAAGATSGASTTYATLFHPANADLYTRVTASGTILIPLCKTQFSELLFSLIYIIFLIVFVAVLAIKSRGIRDNYREATYIGLAIGGAIPIWLGWTLCGLAVAERHKDACIAFGLVATSATVFLVMFMPKGRQLAAMGKEGLYVEDREEQFSSLSRAGSGYSPSFFHFKPIKYGVMSGGGGGGCGGGGGGGLQHSASNTANATNGGKHCSNGGDRVALVSAAPPSYTRMYHYFPAPLPPPAPPTHHHHHHHPFCYYPQPPIPPPIPPPPPPTLPLTPQHAGAIIAPIAPPPQQLAPPQMSQSQQTAQLTQLATPPTLKQLGNSLASMTQAHIAQTLRYPGLFIRPDETNLYTTLEPTLSSNPNVYFQRGGAVHPGMMY